MDYGCAYACAPHLVQSQRIHCQIIVCVIKVRWATVTIAYIDVERFPKFKLMTASQSPTTFVSKDITLWVSHSNWISLLSAYRQKFQCSLQIRTHSCYSLPITTQDVILLKTTCSELDECNEYHNYIVHTQQDHCSSTWYFAYVWIRNHKN